MKALLLALTATLLSSSLYAFEECPVKFGDEDYIEKVATLAENASSCYEASEIVNSCALAAGGDVYMVSGAVTRCEKDFPKMSSKDKKTYEYLNTKCYEKYKDMQGSMYRSAYAFCTLSVASLYSELLSKAE